MKCPCKQPFRLSTYPKRQPFQYPCLSSFPDPSSHSYPYSDSDSQSNLSNRQKQNPGYHSPLLIISTHPQTSNLKHPNHHRPTNPNPEHKSNAPSTLASNSPTLSFNPRFSALRSPTVSHATLESCPRQFAHPASSPSSTISVSFEEDEERVSRRANVDFCCWGFGR